jgi:hypothetical protein
MLTQEYFEKTIIPVPPIILIWYLFIIARFIWYQLKQSCKKQNSFEKNKGHVTGIFSKFRLIVSSFDKCVTDLLQR